MLVESKLNRHIPILFPENLCHDLMYESMKHYPFSGEVTIVSAGTFNTDTNIAYGRSTTLNLKSRKEDSSIIANYNYLHGIVT